MNAAKLRAFFGRNRLALGAGGAAVALGAIAVKRRGASAATSTSAETVQAPRGGAAVYDSTATDLASYLQPEIEAGANRIITALNELGDELRNPRPVGDTTPPLPTPAPMPLPGPILVPAPSAPRPTAPAPSALRVPAPTFGVTPQRPQGFMDYGNGRRIEKQWSAGTRPREKTRRGRG